jgi:hypothetical protein
MLPLGGYCQIVKHVACQKRDSGVSAASRRYFVAAIGALPAPFV